MRKFRLVACCGEEVYLCPFLANSKHERSGAYKFNKYQKLIDASRNLFWGGNAVKRKLFVSLFLIPGASRFSDFNRGLPVKS